MLGKAREGLAFFLIDRKRALTTYQIYYQRALAAMASGNYKEPDDIVNNIAGKMTDILYNKDYDEEIPDDRDVSEMGSSEIKDLWKDLVGEEWPQSSKSKKDQVSGQ